MRWMETWAASALYRAGDVVSYSGTTYVSRTGLNLNHLPTDTAWWTAVGGGGGSYSAGSGLSLSGTTFSVDFSAVASAAALSTEASARASADTSEASTRAAADTALSASIAAITTTSLGAIPTSALSSATPQALGTAAAGSSTNVSRADHVHAMPSAAGVGALATSALSSATPHALGTAAAGLSSSVSRDDHVHAMPAASDVGAVPTARTVNGYALSSNVSLAASDVGAVPTTRQVNGHALSADVTVTASDVGAIATSALSSATPQPVGTGAAGSSSNVSRADHVHPAVIPPPLTLDLGGPASVDATMATSASWAIGGTPYAPLSSDFTVTGRTQAFTLVFSARATTGQTGYVDLFDTSTGLSVIGGPVSVTGSASLAAFSAAVTLNGSAHSYELRAGCSGTNQQHFIAVDSAAIKVTWS